MFDVHLNISFLITDLLVICGLRGESADEKATQRQFGDWFSNANKKLKNAKEKKNHP